MTPAETLVPTYLQMLKRLSGWLDKAAAQMPGARGEALLSARLAPDMFPLATQIRFACVQAREGMCQLADEPFPDVIAELLEEGRAAGKCPGSMADARTRIADTMAVLESLLPGAPVRPAEDGLAHELPNGMVFDLTAGQYVRDWALPQFYFHLMTAYAILRAEGIELGKADYVSHMFAYLRPGTMPDA